MVQGHISRPRRSCGALPLPSSKRSMCRQCECFSRSTETRRTISARTFAKCSSVAGTSKSSITLRAKRSIDSSFSAAMGGMSFQERTMSRKARTAAHRPTISGHPPSRARRSGRTVGPDGFGERRL